MEPVYVLEVQLYHVAGVLYVCELNTNEGLSIYSLTTDINGAKPVDIHTARYICHSPHWDDHPNNTIRGIHMVPVIVQISRIEG